MVESALCCAFSAFADPARYPVHLQEGGLFSHNEEGRQGGSRRVSFRGISRRRILGQNACRYGGTVVNELLRKEELVEQCVRENRPAEAIRHLFDLIVEYAARREFPKAEALREKIFEIDSLALSEIVRSAEIIEDAKHQSIDRDRQELWSELFSILTTEEANALYYALVDKTYEADQTVFEHGSRNQYLYFINSGRLKMIHSRKGQEILLKTLNSGEIFGEDTFFTVALCTTSVITMSNTRISVLSHDYLKKWKTELPVLESKLFEYSHRSVRVKDLLKQKELDRRIYKRVPLSGKAEIQILKASGLPVGGAFKASLSDISMGGVCFLVRINKKETARLLLAQKLNVKFTHSGENFFHEIEKIGLVVAVRSHAFEDYSVHVKFNVLLDKGVVADIENYPGPVTAL